MKKYDTEKIVRLYKNGYSIYKIAETLMLPKDTIRRHLEKAGITKEMRIIGGQSIGEHSKEVEMIDPLTMETIKRFSSHGEAYRYLGCENHGNISAAIKNGHKYKGYYWKNID